MIYKIYCICVYLLLFALRLAGICCYLHYGWQAFLLFYFVYICWKLRFSILSFSGFMAFKR